MVIVMRADATEEQLGRVRQRIEGLGLRAHVSRGAERTVVGVVGDERPLEPESFEVLPGVERAMRILHRYKLATREFHPDDRIITLPNGQQLGGSDVLVIAGPCAVESRDQLEATAAGVAAAGAKVLRGGAFKPRTSPYSFQGIGEKALILLREVADAFGMAVVSEVVTPEDVPLVSEYVEMLQVGARNMTNFSLLQAVGNSGHAVLLKRGFGSTVDELLQAAEYILARGNEDVAVCERGIRTFESSTRFTLDINAVPVLKQLSSLPVVVDPSHAAGRADLVTPIARAGVAAGCDGLLVEVHNDPAEAISDGAQSLSPDAFARLVHDVAKMAQALGRGVA
jgi:3-deoxy-7-phosphoheptulonate synthase